MLNPHEARRLLLGFSMVKVRTKNTKNLSSLLVFAPMLLSLLACQGNNVDMTGELPLSENYGLTNGSIAGVSDPISRQAHRIEWAVYASAKSRNPEDTGYCTGSLIDQNLMVTVSHCVPDPDQFGSMTVLFLLPNGKTKKIAVVDWERNRNEDLALLKLAEDAPESAEILSLPRYDYAYNPSSVLVAGYGVTSKPDPNRPGIGGRTLRKAILDVALYIPGKDRFTTESGVCHGDSGGPAILEEDGKPILFGVIISFSYAPNSEVHCSGASIFAHIPYFVPWFERTATKLTARSKGPDNLIIAKTTK